MQKRSVCRTFTTSATAFVLLAMPFLAVATGHGEPPSPSTNPNAVNLGSVLSYASVAVGLATLVIIYLSGNIQKYIKYRQTLIENQQLRSQLEQLSGPKLETIPTTTNELFSAIHLAKARAEFSISRSENDAQILSMERRAYLNLAMGILISAAAILVLLTQAMAVPPADLTWPSLFVTYFPKGITCIFIELLALFFLRLYRASLNEIRIAYAGSRDLTLKQIAFESAWSQADPGTATAKLALALLNGPTPLKQDTPADELADIKALTEIVERLSKVVSKKDG